MISRIEKERIKVLLRETITLLCKNGLPYRQEFNLEALIGITLDKKDVLLISLNELIRGHSNSSTESCHILTKTMQDMQKQTVGKTRRGRGRPPKRRKAAPSPEDHTCTNPENNTATTDVSQNSKAPQNQNGTGLVQNLNTGVNSSSEESSSSDSECGSDELTEDQKSLLAKMKEAVNQQIKKESNNSPGRDNTGLQPMDIEESQKIWQKAFEMARITKQSDGRRKKPSGGDNKEKCASSEQEAQEPSDSLPSPMCHICGKTMSTEKNLTKHVRRHLGMFSVYCDECGKGFFDRTDLDSHTAKHQDTKLYQCDICGRSYSHKRGLYKHIRKDHQSGDDRDIDEVIEKASVIEKQTPQPPLSATVTPPTLSYPQASVHCAMSNMPQVSHTPNMSHIPDLSQPADLSQQSHLSQIHHATDLSQPATAQHALALAQVSVMSPPPPPPPPPMIHHHSGLSAAPLLPLSSNLPPHFQYSPAQQHPPSLHQSPYPRY